ncbi:MAG: peptidyl-tRNA hydrolase, family [Frankiaceae bacterium]|nr:peptidyl-tRNA hydrolase, family [Frankiaceae bacterium]
MPADDLFVVLGLGNPGPGHAGNRHNFGAMVVDLLAERLGTRFSKGARGRADVAEGRLGPAGRGPRVVLAKPRSYMNESGGPAAAVLGFYKVAPEQLVVVHDELDLPFGTIKLKRGGGHGGHNGLRSLDQSLGSKEYLRVRVGIGRPPGRQDPADYVLKDFGSGERKELPLEIERAADAVEAVVIEGLEPAQNVFH